jgi:hypothetical protein
VTSALGGASRHAVRRLRNVQLIQLAASATSPAETKWLKRTLGRKSPLVRIVLGSGVCGSVGGAPVRILVQRYAVRLAISGGQGSIRTCAGSDPARSVARPTRGFVYVTVDVGGVLVRSVAPSGKTIDRARVPG